MKYELYCIVNKINKKRYVGITTLGVERRFNNHKCNARKKINRPLYDSMNKYGIDNFEIEFIKEANSFSELVDLEVEYIKKYNTYFFDKDSKGYNCTRGGEGTLGRSGEKHPMYGKKHSQKTREEISNKIRGVKHPQYGRKGELSHRYGKTFSDEVKKKLSEINKGRVFTEESKRKMSESRKGYVMPKETKEKISAKMKKVYAEMDKESFDEMVKKCQKNAHNKRECIIFQDEEKIEFLSVMECARYVKEKFELEDSLNAISKALRRRIGTEKKCYEKFYIKYK